MAHGPSNGRRRASLRRRRGSSLRRGARARRHLPARPRRPDARARPLRRAGAVHVRRPRARRDHLRARDRGALPRLDVARGRDQQPHDGGADRAEPRDRRAAAALPSPLRLRRGARRSRADRAARRHRCPGDPHGRDPPGRRLYRERQQDVHHERPRGQHAGAAGAHRPPRRAPPPRDVLLHRREGAPGVPRHEVRRQARVQGRRHRRARVRRVRRAGGQPRGWHRGARLQARDGRPRGRPDQHRGTRRRRRPGRVRRHADAARPRPPGRAPSGRGHGDEALRSASPHLLGGGHEGPRRAVRPRGRHGKALRLRGRPGHRGGSAPTPRRGRHARPAERRALLPGHAADDHRRGHERDPADDHRAQPRRPVR